MSVFLCSDPFAVKRNVARTVNSQQMYEYILHCLKTTYKYFALSLNMPASNDSVGDRRGRAQQGNAASLSEDIEGQFSQLNIKSQHGSHAKAVENGPEDSDCIIEEEEVEEYSDSDEEREKEKEDLGKSSLSEDEEDQDDDLDIYEDELGRRHLDSLTTEDEEIFLVDEISGEELLSDEEGPDLDTPGSMDEEEEDEEEVVPLSPSPPPEDAVKAEILRNKIQNQITRSYEFNKQSFTRGRVRYTLMFLFYIQHL